MSRRAEAALKEKPSERRAGWLSRSVLRRGLTSLFSDLGHETASSVLPLFLASLGAPAAALGVIEGVSDALSSFAKLGARWIGDRVERRKPIVVGGYVLTGVATGAFGLATAWPQVLVSRAIGWLGRGVRGPLRDAMLADSVEPEARGRAFGLERAGDTLGAVLGPATALLLISALTFRLMFLLTIVHGVIAALCFVVLVRERSRASIRPRRFGEAIGALPPRFRFFLLAVGLFGAGDFAHTLLILHASQALIPSLGPAQAGAVAIGLYTLHNAVCAAANGLGDFISRVVVGGLWTAVSPAVGFLYGAALSLVGAVLMSRVRQEARIA